MNIQRKKKLDACRSGASQMVLVVQNLPANAGDIRDVGSIPRSGRTPGVGNGNPLQWVGKSSCLEKFMNRGAWQITVPRVAKSWTWQQASASTLLIYVITLFSKIYVSSWFEDISWNVIFWIQRPYFLGTFSGMTIAFIDIKIGTQKRFSTCIYILKVQ